MSTSNHLVNDQHLAGRANACNFINPYPDLIDPGAVALGRLRSIAEKIHDNATSPLAARYGDSDRDAKIADHATAALGLIHPDSPNHRRLRAVATDLLQVSDTGLSRLTPGCDQRLDFRGELKKILDVLK